MMKNFVGSKLATRILSCLLTMSMLVCQLPAYAWADDIAPDEAYVESEPTGEVTEPAEGEEPTGEVTGPAEGEEPTGEVTEPAEGEEPTGEVTEPAEGEEPTGEVTEPAEGEEPTGEVTEPAEGEEPTGEVTEPAEGEEPTGEVTEPAEGEEPEQLPTVPAVDVTVLAQMLAELPAVEDYMAMTADKQAEVKTQMALITTLLEQTSEEDLYELDLSRLMALNNYQAQTGKALLAAARALSFSGEGTAESPYQIATAADMQALAKQVNGGNTCADKYFVLSADITLSGEWTAIGTAGAPFAGNFDGNGHKVSGLSITNATADHQGLFGYVNGGSISNLTVEGTVSGSGQYMGGIVGYLAGGTVENCTNNAAVTSTYVNSLACVGGVVGYSMGNINNCINTGKIAADKNYVGGIVGYNIGKAAGLNNSGAVSGRNRAGGVAGYSVSITNAANSGNVTAENQYAGGIVGGCAQDAVLRHVNVENCRVSGADYVGAVCGSGDVEWGFINAVTLPQPEVAYQGVTAEGTAANTCENSDTLTVDAKLLRSFLTENETTDFNGYWVLSGGALKLDAASSKMVYKSKFIDQSAGKVAKLTFKVDGVDVPESQVYENCVYAVDGSKITITPVAAVEEGVTADISGFKFGNAAVVKNGDAWELAVEKDASYEYGFGNFRSETAEARYGWYLKDTKATEFHISNVDEFAGLGEIIRGEAVDLNGEALAAYAFSSKKIYIDNDIDLSTVCGEKLGSWQPIKATSMSVYGQGHTISGLYIDTTTQAFKEYIGLFGYIKSVQDLTVEGNIKVTDTKGSIIGGVAGRVTTADNCISKVNINVADEYGSTVGGVIGKSWGSTVNSCYNMGNITVKLVEGIIRIGGVVGSTYGSWGSYNTVTNSLASGKIEVTNDAANADMQSIIVGGIVGDKEGSSGTWTIQGNVFVGSIAVPDADKVLTKVAPVFNNKLTNCYYLDGTPNTGSFAGTAKTKAELGDLAFIYELDGGSGVWGIKDAMPAFVSAGADSIECVSVKSFSPAYTLSFSRVGEGIAPVYQADFGRVLTTPGSLKLTVSPTADFKLYANGTELTAAEDGTYTVTVAAGKQMMLECGNAAAIEEAIGVAGNLGWYTEHSTETTLYIGTAAELYSMAALVNGKASGYNAVSLSGKTIELTADIDLSVYPTWDAIGSAVSPFEGSFNGAGHSITGVNVNKPTADYQGLFGYVGGSVSDVKVSGSVVGKDYVGLLAGYVNTNVSNVEVSNANVTGNDWVGGVCGYVRGYATCQNIVNASGTVKGHDYVGGVFGERISMNGTNYNNYANAMLKCAALDVTVSGNDCVGGILGKGVQSTLSSSYGNVRDSYSLAAVSAAAEGAKVGGVAGETTRVLSSFCYNENTAVAAVGTGAVKNVYYLAKDGNKIGDGADIPKTAAAFAGREVAWGLDTPNGSHNDLWQVGEKHPVWGADTVDEEGNTVAYNGENNVYKVTLKDVGAVAFDAAGTTLAVINDDEAKTQTVYMVAGEKINIKYTAPEDKKDCKPYFDTELVTANADGTYSLTVEKADKDYTIGYSLLKPAESSTKWYTDNAAAETYIISNLDDLWGFANLVNGNVAGMAAQNFAGKTVKLADDLKDGKIIIPIAAAGEDVWGGIGKNAARSFCGTFDGNGKTIEYHFNDSTAQNIGLFAYLGEGAVVKNLTVEGDVTAMSYVGGLVANAAEKVTIENCTNKVKVTANRAESAGIVAKAGAGLVIKNCVNEADLAAGAGIVGTLGTSTELETIVENCVNNGKISFNRTIGGIIGTDDGRDTKLTLRNLTNNGDITTTGSAGGIAYTINANATLDNCVNNGKVEGGSRTGGIIASLSGDIVAANLFNNGDVSAPTQTAVGGIIGYRSGACQITRAYNTGNITGGGYSTNGVGGIIGQFYYIGGDGVLNYCYNTGDITYNGTGSGYLGGIVGGGQSRASGKNIINNCFNYGKITAANKRYNLSAINAAGNVSNSASLTNCYSVDDASWYTLAGKPTACADAGKFTAVKVGPQGFASYLMAMKLNGKTDDAAFTYNFGDAHPTLADKPFDATGAALIVSEETAGGKITVNGSHAAYAYPEIGKTVTVVVTPDAGKLISSYGLADLDGSAYPFKAAEAEGAMTLTFTMPGKDLVVKAAFVAAEEIDQTQKVTVTFNANGGAWGVQTTKTLSVAKGSRLLNNSDMPQNPTKAGESFMGWYVDEACTEAYNMNTMLTEDITLYARFADAVEVTYLYENAVMQTTDGDKPDEYKVLVGKGSMLAAPDVDPERSGYSFIGWYSDAELLHEFEFGKPVKQNVTVYAGFVQNGYAAVKFDLNGGLFGHQDYIERQDIKLGEKVTEPQSSKLTHLDGYPFAGWYTDKYDENTKWDFNTEVSASMTLYAHWVGDNYKIEQGGVTEEDAYVIESLEQLMALRDAVNSGNHFTKQYFKLGADIELPAGWTSIGLPENKNAVTKYFAGIFDGDGYTITYQKGAQSLFGAAGGYDQWMSYDKEEGMCTIKNLKLAGDVTGAGLVESAADTLWLDNITVLGGTTTTGSGIMGSHCVIPSVYTCKIYIENCTVEAGCTIGSADADDIGGLLGYMTRGEITNCSTEADVIGRNFVGGITGKSSSSGKIVAITQCYVGGTVTGNTMVGGIAGNAGNIDSMNYVSSGIDYFKDCICEATVSGNDIVGGLVGGSSLMSTVYSPFMTSNYFTGTVESDGFYVGPIIGRMVLDPKGYVVVGSSPWDMFEDVSAALYTAQVAPTENTVKWLYKNGSSEADVIQNEKEHLIAVTPELAGTGYDAYMLDGADGVHRDIWTIVDGKAVWTKDSSVGSVYKAEYKVEGGNATVAMHGIKQNAQGSNVVYSMVGNDVALDITTGYYAEPEVTEEGTTYYVYTVDSAKLDYVEKSYDKDEKVVETPGTAEVDVQATGNTSFAASFTMPGGNAVITLTLGKDEIFEPKVEDEDEDAGYRGDENHGGSGNGAGSGTGTGTGSGTASGDGVGSGTGEGQGSGTGDGTGSGNGGGTLVTEPSGSNNTPGATNVAVVPVTDAVDMPSQVITPVDEPVADAEVDTNVDVEQPTADSTEEGGSEGGNEGGDGDEEEVQLSVFEVIRTTLQENPLITTIVLLMIAAIIAASGYNRYRKNKK